MRRIIKEFYRFFRYSAFRKKVFREIKLHQIQNRRLAKEYESTTKSVIIFIIPGADMSSGTESVSGGVISIVSIYEETKRVYSLDVETSVILCTQNEDHALLEFKNFENSARVFRFSQISKYFSGQNSVIIHIPELFVKRFYKTLTKNDLRYFRFVNEVHINILNQSIHLMPNPKEVHALKSFGNKVTITTAHSQYCNEYYRDYYNVPLHKLSVWISPEQYNFRLLENKENLLIYSPDPHPLKSAVIRKLSKVKDLKLQMIENMSYTEYKELISKAKWALTFGEGLDGYFLEPIFSGAVGFAVYNKDFFTEEFKGLKTVYSSFEELYDKICLDIQKLDNKHAYTEYQKQQFEICEQLYNSETYRDNIAKFYDKDYTFK